MLTEKESQELIIEHTINKIMTNGKFNKNLFSKLDIPSKKYNDFTIAYAANRNSLNGKIFIFIDNNNDGFFFIDSYYRENGVLEFKRVFKSTIEYINVKSVFDKFIDNEYSFIKTKDLRSYFYSESEFLSFAKSTITGDYHNKITSSIRVKIMGLLCFHLSRNSETESDLNVPESLLFEYNQMIEYYNEFEVKSNYNYYLACMVVNNIDKIVKDKISIGTILPEII